MQMPLALASYTSIIKNLRNFCITTLHSYKRMMILGFEVCSQDSSAITRIVAIVLVWQVFSWEQCPGSCRSHWKATVKGTRKTKLYQPDQFCNSSQSAYKNSWVKEYMHLVMYKLTETVQRSRTPEKAAQQQRIKTVLHSLCILQG